jgi:hypothetical protein
VAELLSRCLAHLREPLTIALPLDAIPPLRRPTARRQRRLQSVALFLGLSLISSGVMAVLSWRTHQQSSPPSELAPRQSTETRVATSTKMVRRGTDEIDQQFEEVWARAQAIEANLGHTAQAPDHDSVSTVARNLSHQAESLEREIVAGRGPQQSVRSLQSQP